MENGEIYECRNAIVYVYIYIYILCSVSVYYTYIVEHG